MCGIVAVCNKGGTPVDPHVVAAMRDELRHRGPDDGGLLVRNNIGLGHRRLSIVDLSNAGHQPMCNEDGTVWLVFNGEIYNYVELAGELRARGHEFRSQTDSEVILHLYEEEGEHCVSRLNGMFAFVIWDLRTGSIFAARDRLGIKPLYYVDDAERLLCASEIKALLAHPAVPAAPDWQGVADHLFTGHTLGTKTMFAGIRQLPPAHRLTLSNGQVQTSQYWSPRYDYRWNRSFHQVTDDLADLLSDAVRIHCRSDAALGCHLSGGLDSSLVTALAAKHRGQLESFSIRFSEGHYFDESPYARAVAAHVGTVHHEDVPGPDDLASLYARLAWHQDVPMADAAGFTYYAASRLAARHVKVALTGHGGDEVFAGYPAQFETAFGTNAMFDLSKRPREARVDALTRLRRHLGREGVIGLARRVTRRFGTAPRPRLEDLWLTYHCGPDPRSDRRLASQFRSKLAGYTPLPEYLGALEAAPTDQSLDRLLYHDQLVYLPSLLHKEDRASMALSLESRVPLLDYRIIEFLATVPSTQKVPDLVSKALLRAVARPLLPASVVGRRDKTAFPTPETQWLAAGRLPMIDALLGEEQTLERGIYRADDLRSGALEAKARLTAFNIELWFRLFIDRDPYWLGLASNPAVQTASRETLPPLRAARLRYSTS